MNQDRFYQPDNAKAALLKIQTLFNQYANEPLTSELLTYHQKLLAYLKNDVTLFLNEHPNSTQQKNLSQILITMEDWLKIKLKNQPYHGKMVHYQYVPFHNKTKVKHQSLKSSTTTRYKTNNR